MKNNYEDLKKFTLSELGLILLFIKHFHFIDAYKEIKYLKEVVERYD